MPIALLERYDFGIRLTPAPNVWERFECEILADTGSIHNEDHAHLLDAASGSCRHRRASRNRAARIAVDQVIDGKVSDSTGGSTHYYAIAMKTAPAWAAKATQTLKLGGHVFFKDVP